MQAEILDLTEKLFSYNQFCLKMYLEVKEKGLKKDFHEDIKPFADEVKKMNHAWKQLMQLWLKQNPHKHLHLKQITTTSEHIDQLSIQAFFPETSRSRFLNANRTVEYFLLEILKELRK